MAILNVYTFPDPVLKQTAKTIATFDEELQKLADNMLDTMYGFNGIGLAANQVGILKRLVVIDIYSGEEDISKREPHIFVNPAIVEKKGEVISEEGCLSVVEFNAEVKRSESLTLEYQDFIGELHQIQADGLLAICLQHELDHLDGILFIDHLSPLKQKIIKKKLTKQAKKSA
ncbi:MAG: peptide deformylase [SAR324 cluster bacterium]|nr:peptide deformylase [SAR324 cluster bacterium]